MKTINFQQLQNYVQNIKQPTKAELIDWTKKTAKWGSIAAFSLFMFCVILFYLVKWGAFGRLPSKSELKNVENDVASEVYSLDGELLGRYFYRNRTDISYTEIPSSLVEALVSTEDVRFYKHNGIDYRSFLRVAVKSILFQNKNTGGGSTIHQQIAKNIFPREKRGIFSMPINKCREMNIALRLDKIYSKKEILTLYLNTVPFGEDVYGLQVASKRFFNVEPQYLSIEQSAALAGMLQSPSAYNPKRHPERCQFRRNIVFDQMQKNKRISQVEADSLKELPLEVDYQYISHSDGLAPYFRSHLGEELKKFCKNYTKPDGSHYNLYTDGLKIHTTIHSKWQRYAEEAMSEQMTILQKEFNQHWKGRKLWKPSDRAIQYAKQQTSRYKTLKAQGKSEDAINANFSKPVKMKVFSWDEKEAVEMSPMDSIIHYHSLLNAGFIATDPRNGQVRAWVGGIDHEHLQYDHVKAERQAGSVFKPILYTAAIERGYTPCSFIENKLVTYADWTPGNADGKYGGWYTLKGGLANSVNTVAAQLINDIGTEEVVDLATKMGIEGEITNSPSLALGATPVNLKELAEVYGVFANRGKRVALHYLLRIEDKDGQIIYNDQIDDRVRETEIFEPAVADQINRMMLGVVDSGTARSIRYRYGIHAPIAGKTGTTQDQTDGRFVGFTPNVVATSWVGGGDKRVRFRTLGLGSGGHTALPIWARFYKKMSRDKDYKHWNAVDFPILADSLEVDCPNFTLSEEEQFEEREAGDETIFDRLLKKRNQNENFDDQDIKLNERPQRQRSKRRRKKEREQPIRDWWKKKKEKWRD